MIEKLDWDSTFFDREIGRITCSNLTPNKMTGLLNDALDSKMQSLYFEADPNDPVTIATAESNDFHLVDVRVVLEHTFDERPIPEPRYAVPTGVIVTGLKDGDLPQLQKIAEQIGSTSRFHFDSKFGPVESKRLYHLWMVNACKGFADEVLVARCEEAGNAIGLITCTKDDDYAYIQLAGVDESFRKKNIGAVLVRAALDWALEQNVDGMKVVTQARNIPAQRLYQQMNFFMRHTSLYYHWHRGSE